MNKIVEKCLKFSTRLFHQKSKNRSYKENKQIVKLIHRNNLNKLKLLELSID